MKNRSEHTLIFGLTADPIHKGHEQVILNSFTYAKTHGTKIKEFLLLPTYHPNLIANKKQPRTAFKHRFKMCELVASEIRNNHNYPVYVSDIEKQLYLNTQKTSYSYNTLKAIDAPNKLFVLSADHFAGRWPKFRKWYNWQELIKKNGLLIHQRPAHGINANFVNQLKTINPDIFVVSCLPQFNTSSTQLRAAYSSTTKTLKNHVSKSVMSHIEKHVVYMDR